LASGVLELLFYDWPRIHRKTGGSSKRILQAFKAHATTRLPKNRWDPIYDYWNIDFSGQSFMLRPHDLINNYFRYTPKEVAQYIGLASFRSYGYYSATGDASLDLFHSPVDQDTINQNKLLSIVDNRVHFFYEEDIKRRVKIWH
jgi:hypothetical protein